MKRLLVALLALVCAGAAAEPRRRVALVVIVGEASAVTSITSRTLMSLYLGRPADDLVALNRPIRSPERTELDARILRMSPDEVGRYWVDQEVRGERSAPAAIASSVTLARLVMKFPSAVGYLRLDEAPRGVRVLRLDGRLPGDAGYPLWIEVGP